MLESGEIIDITESGEIQIIMNEVVKQEVKSLSKKIDSYVDKIKSILKDMDSKTDKVNVPCNTLTSHAEKIIMAKRNE